MATFDPWLAAGSFLAGGTLGAVFFGGLWWTVRRLTAQRRSLGWLAVSFAVRGAIALAGFALLARIGGWWSPAVALLGFMAARQVLVRRLEPASGRAAQRGLADRLERER